MDLQTYNFEIKDILTQFVNAFDGVVISRFTKAREAVDNIAVRYLYAPKQRVLHDLINKAQHITLPVVAIHIQSISYNSKRVFNKIQGSTYTLNSAVSATKTGQLPQPVPVDIVVNMSIVTKYQTDMDQIISNWLPYTNPYIVISWKKHELTSIELRSKVIWNGNLVMGYPIDINATQPARVTCDTSFTIEGWLFKDDASPNGTIFNVDANFTAVNKLEDVDTMAALRTSYNTDERGIIGRPQLTFLTPYVIDIEQVSEDFSLYGRMFTYTTSVYASGDTFVQSLSTQDPFTGTSLSATYPAFNGIPVEYEVESDNLITFQLPSLTATGKVDIIVVNPAGYGILTVDTTSDVGTYEFPFSNGIDVV